MIKFFLLLITLTTSFANFYLLDGRQVPQINIDRMCYYTIYHKPFYNNTTNLTLR